MIRSLRLRRYAPDLLAALALVAVALLLGRAAYMLPRTAHLPLDAPPVVLPLDGFHEPEQFADRPGIYRWSRGGATLKLPNPGGPVALRVVLAGGPGRSVPVRVHVAGATFAIAVQPEPRSYALALPPSGGERIALAIEAPVLVDRNRELGVAVGEIAISGGGAAPVRVPLALAAAAIGFYALLRQAGLGRAYALGGALVAQALAALWQAAGLWQYGLLGPLLLLVGGASLAAVAIERVWPPAPAPEAPAAVLSRRDLAIVALLAAAALCVRLPWLAAPDPVGDLELSARRMGFLYEHGLAGAYMFDGDYMPLRLYWLLGLSHLAPLLGGSFHNPLPAPTLLLIKLPGLLADLATVALIYVWCRRWRPARSAAALTALYTLAPPVWMVVAWWGQVDAIQLLPLLLMVVLLDRAGGRWSWLCWAAALLIKTQAIVFAPLLFVATLRRYGCRGLARGGALAAALLAVGCAPLALAGQGPGMVQAYVGAVGRFPQVTNRAYNLWYLAPLGAGGSDQARALGLVSYRAVGMLLLGAVALLICLALLRRYDGPARAEGAGLLALAFFLLPTQIHERYLFFALAFLVLRAASDLRIVAAYLALVATATLNILGALRGFWPGATAAIVASPLPLAIAAANLAVLVVLLGHMWVTSRTTSAATPAPEGRLSPTG